MITENVLKQIAELVGFPRDVAPDSRLNQLRNKTLREVVGEIENLILKENEPTPIIMAEVVEKPIKRSRKARYI